VLVLLVVGVFGQTVGHGFINYDTDQYLYANPRVLEGLTGENVQWAFTTFYFSNWHPLTWLSHMASADMFGANPTGHHLVNVLFHGAGAVLLFLGLSRMTGAPWRSAFVAALFAVHPLNVEPVAWVSSRKDVLSAFFAFAAIFAYGHYAKAPSFGRYAFVGILFALGLMSKSMAVTLPCVFLLLDFWPLRRISLWQRDGAATWKRPVLEKAPMIALSAAVGAVTIVSQRAGGAMVSLEQSPLTMRAANVTLGYWTYLRKAFWPADLAVFYPMSDSVPAWRVGLAIALLVVVTLGCFLYLRRAPYLSVGWLWFVGMLVPAIGFVQVGESAVADRYAYIPLVGLFIMAAWGMPAILPRVKWRRPVLAGLAGVVIAALSITAWQQARLWRDEVVLYRHSMAVAGPSSRLLNNLGNALLERQQYEDAIESFKEALDRNPNALNVHNNLGAALLFTEKYDEAVVYLEEALTREPDNAVALTNLAYAEARLGNREAALGHAQRAVEADPAYGKARALLEALQQGRAIE